MLNVAVMTLHIKLHFVNVKYFYLIAFMPCKVKCYQ